MTIVFRIAYSLSVALLFILSVIFGTRTLYSEPGYPQYPMAPPRAEGMIYCDAPGNCYIETYDPAVGVPSRTLITPELEDSLTDAERDFIAAARDYYEEEDQYEDDRRAYFRNAFIIAAFWGVIAIAGAVVLYRRVEAMPLGFLLGGIGSLIYGWVEWSRGPEEASTSVTFGIVTIGLVLVLAGGYYFLGGRDSARLDRDG